MFDISLSKLIFTIAAGGYLIGKKDLPKATQLLGNIVGKTVGGILRAKNEYFNATKDSDIIKLQAEFQKGMEELNAIRTELTAVSNMSRPHRPTSASLNKTINSSVPEFQIKSQNIQTSVPLRMLNNQITDYPSNKKCTATGVDYVASSILISMSSTNALNDINNLKNQPNLIKENSKKK